VIRFKLAQMARQVESAHAWLESITSEHRDKTKERTDHVPTVHGQAICAASKLAGWLVVSSLLSSLSVPICACQFFLF
jgi:hypothetical protein